MAEKRDWSTEEIFSLLAQWESHPELWNTNSQDYQNKQKRQNAFKELAALFNTDIYEIQRKLHNLRTQYSQELRRIANKRAKNENCSPRTPWRFFNAMNFIRNSTTNLNTLSSSILQDRKFKGDGPEYTLEISEVRSEATEEYLLPDIQMDADEIASHEEEVSSCPLVERSDNDVEDSENRNHEFPERMKEMPEKEGITQKIPVQYRQMTLPVRESHTTDQSELNEIESEGRWPDDKTLQLIKLFEKAEILWNKNHKDYKNISKKEMLIKEIAMKMDLGVGLVKRKIHNLRNQYGGERRKLLRRLRKASKEDKPKIRCRWRFYKALNFLESVTDERENNVDSLESVNEDQSVDSGSSCSDEDLDSADPSMTFSHSIQRSKNNKMYKSPKPSDGGDNFENRVVDQHQVFADFLASELRVYPERFAAKLKHKVLKALLEVSEEYLQETEKNKDVS